MSWGCARRLAATSCRRLPDLHTGLSEGAFLEEAVPALSLFLLTNLVIVFTLGMKPVFLIRISAILDGLLLTPLQALWVAIGLFVALPRML